LNSVAGNIKGATLCALGEFAINPVLATIQHFPEDYKEYIKQAEEKKLPAKKVAVSGD
jgi:NADH:ubiquinone oxidoreductase subunit F (NADH-binding)